jgi:thiol-disulfide isomerase/thioredoxin
LGNGPAVHLAGLTGMPTVVNLWGSWCIPCQQEAAVLSKVYDADRGKVRFLGVDTADDPDSALDFGAHVTPPVRYPSVVDPDKKVLLGLAKAPGPPQTAFINAAGAVVHVKIGPYTSAAALRSDLATYLHV